MLHRFPLLLALLLAGCNVANSGLLLEHDQFIVKGKALNVFFENRLGRHLGYIENPQIIRGNVDNWQYFVTCRESCRIEFELPNNADDIDKYRTMIGDSIVVILRTPGYYKSAACRLVGYAEE